MKDFFNVIYFLIGLGLFVIAISIISFKSGLEEGKHYCKHNQVPKEVSNE